MTAKEMFEELGYEQILSDERLIVYRRLSKTRYGLKENETFMEKIVFEYEYKKCYSEQYLIEESSPKMITVLRGRSANEMLSFLKPSITKQMEELGWLE